MNHIFVQIGGQLAQRSIKLLRLAILYTKHKALRPTVRYRAYEISLTLTGSVFHGTRCMVAMVHMVDGHKLVFTVLTDF